MDEREWLADTNLNAMLKAIQGKGRDRKLRLYAVACCRQIWDLLTDDPSRAAVETAERYADGQATADQLVAARPEARRAAQARSWRHKAQEAVQSACMGCAFEAAPCAFSDASSAAPMHEFGIDSDAADESVWSDPTLKTAYFERLRKSGSTLVALLRDIGGNPFRPVVLDPAWLTWHDGLIRRLAQVAYDERQLPSGHLDLDRLAVLADALEEAGCDNQDILDHLGSPGPHTRGCWAVDLCLGKS